MRNEGLGYPPYDTPKRVADDLWVVDGAPKRVGVVSVPVRMTVVRLGDGGLWLHSPTRFSPDLLAALEPLGPVRHLVAPSFAHWTYVSEWQQHCPKATTWAAPQLRRRPQVRISKLRIDRELGEDVPGAWAGDLRQTVVPGALGFREVAFLHVPSRSLILTDLVANVETANAPMPTRLFARLSGTAAPGGGTPRYLRAVIGARRREAAAAVRRLLEWTPERVIFAHGRWYSHEGTRKLRQAMSWLLD